MQCQGPVESYALFHAGCQLWQIRGALTKYLSLERAKAWDQHTHTNAQHNRQCRLWCGNVPPFLQGATGCSPCQCQDKCQLLNTLLQTQSTGRYSVRCVMGKRERGSMCPMTPCGARQMSMFSRQLFKAIQSFSHWRLNGTVIVGVSSTA